MCNIRIIFRAHGLFKLASHVSFFHIWNQLLHSEELIATYKSHFSVYFLLTTWVWTLDVC